MEQYEITQIGERNKRTLQFCQDSLRTTSWFYIYWLLLGFVISFVAYYVYRYEPVSAIRPALFAYYLIVAIHIIFRLKKGGKANVLAPDIVFILIYTLFHLGYVTLFDIGIIQYKKEIFFFRDSIPKAMFVINLGLLGFLFGYEVVGPKNMGATYQERVKIPKSSWCHFGIVLMVAALLMHLFTLAYLGPNLFIKHGYEAVQNISNYTTYIWSVLWSESITLMVLGLSIYLVASALRYGRLFSSIFALVLVISFFVLVILEGNRGPILKFGIPILLVRHYFIKPIPIRYLAVVCLAAMVLFSAMSVARTIVLDPKKMWQEYENKRSAGAVDWMSPLVEMGSSFLILSITCHDVPEKKPYWKGASWRDAAIHAVPFLQRYAINLGISTWAPSTWITTTYFGKKRAGRAFTVAAEGYLNFGLPGAFIELMFFGLFIRWLSIRFSKKPSAMWALIFFGCLGPSIVVIRNHASLVIRVCVQVIVLATLLNNFFGNESESHFERERTAALR